MSGETPFLARPCWQYQDSYIEAVYEYIEENLELTWHPEILKERFDEFLEVVCHAETEPLAGMAPATQFWMIAPSIGYVGELGLRHHLNDNLRRFGGHIGYTVRPSQRGRGFGKLICKLGIEAARKRGIGDVLITCDDDNLASCKIIEANGGQLVDRIDNGRGALTRRYWVYDYE